MGNCLLDMAEWLRKAELVTGCMLNALLKR